MASLAHEGEAISPQPNPIPHGEKRGWKPKRTGQRNMETETANWTTKNYRTLKEPIEITTHQRKHYRKKRKNIYWTAKRHDYAQTNIGLKDGERGLHIASLNMDDFRTTESYSELTLRLQRQQIDIACVQETRNTSTLKYDYNNYTIHFAPEIPIAQNDEANNTQNIKGNGATQ